MINNITMIKNIIRFIIKYPLSTIFATFLVAFLVSYNVTKDVEFSQVENRYLAKRPSIVLEGLADGTYMREFEKYCEEQLPLRDALIKTKAVCEMCLLKCENNGIARGEDGYLFEKVTGVSGQFHKNISSIAAFIKGVDRDVFVAIAPNSFYIYNDKVPLGMPSLDEDELYNELVDATKDYSNACIIDLNSALKVVGSEEYYYKTDHHWTSEGAYVAYEKISDAMDLTPVLLDGLNVNQVNDFYGTYYAKYKGVGIKGDVLRYYDFAISEYDDGSELHSDLYDLSKLGTYDKYAMFMYGNPAQALVKTSTGGDSSLIILKNSYANSLIPFLTSNYGTIVTVDLRYFSGSVSEVLDKYEDADVLLLYDWSFINDDNHFYKLVK